MRDNVIADPPRECAVHCGHVRAWGRSDVTLGSRTFTDLLRVAADQPWSELVLRIGVVRPHGENFRGSGEKMYICDVLFVANQSRR